MDANAILDRLSTLGVTARVEADKILIQPASKVPSELMDAIREHKPELLIILAEPRKNEALLDRLRTGHRWLLDAHKRWQAGDTTAADDTEFSRVWDSWWGLDFRLRAEYGLAGCIYGPSGKCPGDVGCIGCVDALPPAVVAQLALTAESA